MRRIETVYAWRRRSAVSVVAVLLGLLFAFVLFPRAICKTGSDKNKVTDLQRAASPEEFRRVLTSWCNDDRPDNPCAPVKPDAVGVMKCENIIKLDIVFPIIYALALGFGYAALRGNRAPDRLDLALFLAPFVAGLFDLVENGLHLYLLNGIDTCSQAAAANFSPALVSAAASFAGMKYCLLTLTIIACLVAIVSAAVRRSRKTS